MIKCLYFIFKDVVVGILHFLDLYLFCRLGPWDGSSKQIVLRH